MSWSRLLAEVWVWIPTGSTCCKLISGSYQLWTLHWSDILCALLGWRANYSCINHNFFWICQSRFDDFNRTIIYFENMENDSCPAWLWSPTTYFKFNCSLKNLFLWQFFMTSKTVMWSYHGGLTFHHLKNKMFWFCVSHIICLPICTNSPGNFNYIQGCS